MPRAETRTVKAAPARVLVVDDAPDTLELIQRNLRSQGHEVITAVRGADALALLDRMSFELVLTDVRMPGMSGIELIHEVRARHPAVELVVITGYATVEGAVEALHAGAWDYLSKPFTDDELFAAVDRALARRRAPGSSAPAPLPEFHGLLGDAQGVRVMRDALALAARDTAPVRLVGESGSGREAAARALHAASGRHGPFVRVSADVRPASGAADEAVQSLTTAAAQAAAGTLYLSGFDAAPAALRAAAARLARSAAGPRGADGAARWVVSVNALADEPAGAGLRFGHTIAVPPLRERGDDVVRLSQRFVAERAARRGGPARVFGPRAELALRHYPWPGNLRELRDCCRSIATGGTGAIEPDELPAVVAAAAGRDDGPPLTLAALERRHIETVLRGAGGNKSRAAELLGIDRKTLREKLRDRTGPGGETG